MGSRRPGRATTSLSTSLLVGQRGAAHRKWEAETKAPERERRRLSERRPTRGTGFTWPGANVGRPRHRQGPPRQATVHPAGSAAPETRSGCCAQKSEPLRIPPAISPSGTDETTQSQFREGRQSVETTVKRHKAVNTQRGRTHQGLSEAEFVIATLHGLTLTRLLCANHVHAESPLEPGLVRRAPRSCPRPPPSPVGKSHRSRTG